MKRLNILVIILSAAAVLYGCAGPGQPDFPPEPEGQVEEEEREPALPFAETVASITPSQRALILEKAKENEDTVGWLVVPGTDIDSVIVQNPISGTNSYYTTHDFYHNSDPNGTYCADRRCIFGGGTRSEISANITLYGHNFSEDPDGELFAQLKRFKDPEFAAAHPYIFFSTAGEDMAWEIFAIYDATVDLPYIWPDLSWNVLDQVMQVAYNASIYDYGVKVSAEDKILTLSSCSYSVPGNEALPLDQVNDYRFVIMARLVEPEAPITQQAQFTQNSSPLAPDDIPSIDFNPNVDHLSMRQ